MYIPLASQRGHILLASPRGGIYPGLSILSLPIRPPPYAQPCRYPEPMPYTLVDRDEYGHGYAALTFDSPEHARDHLRWLLSSTDNTAIELALQEALDEAENDLADAEDL